MLNRDVFQTDPREYRLANEGVAKVVFPPPPEVLATLRGELQTFVCDGAYAQGLARILEAFTGAVGRSATIPAAWISGFYGSGKSHLASMLAALWTDLSFPDGATAEGLVSRLPNPVLAPLRELRGAGKRMGGLLACGDTLGQGPADPMEATLGILFRAVGLPADLRAAEVAFWLDDLGVLERVRGNLGERFETDIRNFILSPRFADAVLAARPDIATNRADLQGKLKAQFAEPPPIADDTLVRLGKRALLLGRKEIPLTLVVLDEVQQLIRTNQDLTLRIQGIAETLSARFEGRVLLVCTGQQALSDAENLQKLLGRFPVQVALGEADIDAVIRQTVLRKKAEAEPAIKEMLAGVAGEVSRHLRGSRLAQRPGDDRDAVLDWPLLPSRRRVWEAILRELDRTGLGGTLRGQLRTALAAAAAYAEAPLGYAVPGDFLYDRFAAEAVNAGLLPGESRAAIERLRGSTGDDPLKARMLMLIYMLGRIQGSAEFHGVRTEAETLADLLVVDLAGDPELRRKVPILLEEMQNQGLVIEAESGWRLQTRESAEWEQAFRTELAAQKSDSSAVARRRREMLDAAIDEALKGATWVPQGGAHCRRGGGGGCHPAAWRRGA